MSHAEPAAEPADDLPPETEFKHSAERMAADLKKAAATLTVDEARFLVDAYYQMQQDRIRAAHQLRTLAQSTPEKPVEPHIIMPWLMAQRQMLERQVGGALSIYSNAQLLGRWARSIMGIGPIISAGLLAHIDITRAPTAGHVWSFAGLNPTAKWDRGQKRPWNADLKRLCFLIGESFVKVHNRDGDVYGKVYEARKKVELERNEAGQFAEQARISLETKNFRKGTEARKAYEQGKLPLARINMRAKRYAVKLFLAHYHHVAYELHYHEAPPKPYMMEHHGHVHFIAPPNWPMQ